MKGYVVYRTKDSCGDDPILCWEGVRKFHRTLDHLLNDDRPWGSYENASYGGHSHKVGLGHGFVVSVEEAREIEKLSTL